MKVLTKLRSSEPVRLYVFPLLVVLVGTLVTKGVLDGDTATLVIGLVTAVLGLGAQEVARAKVTPAGRAAEVVVDVVEQVQAVASTNPQVQAALDRAREFALGLGKHRA